MLTAIYSCPQCDEGKPNCANCIKSGLICPGYRMQLDVVLREQNKTAERASLKRQKRALLKREQDSTPNLSVVGVPSLRVLPSTGPLTSLDTAFYFTTSFQDIVAVGRANCPGYIEFLPFAYSMTAPDSALAFATQALASSFHGAWTGTGSEKDAENRKSRTMLGKALLATQQAISDPIKSKSDETLMAVLILRLYDVRNRQPCMY